MVRHQGWVSIIVNSSGVIHTSDCCHALCCCPSSWSHCVILSSELHHPCWSWAPVIHHICSRNEGVKVQEIGLSPSPARGWSRVKKMAVVIALILCTKQRSVNLGLSLSLHSGKWKMQELCFCCWLCSLTLGNMLSTGELPFEKPFSKFQDWTRWKETSEKHGQKGGSRGKIEREIFALRLCFERLRVIWVWNI